MTLWEEAKRNLVEWYETAADKTGELAKVGVRRYDIFGISRDIERQFSEIGSHVYTALHGGRSDFTDDVVLQGLVVRVEALERDLKAKQAEIDAIRKAGRQESPHATEAAEAAVGGDEAAGAPEGSEGAEGPRDETS